MRYDSEMERALMRIDQIVDSTLRRRALRGPEKERMDPGDMFRQALEFWMSIPPDMKVQLGMNLWNWLKFGWAMTDPHRVQILAAAADKLQRAGITHPWLQEAQKRRNRMSLPDKQRAQQLRAERKQQRRGARRKDRTRSKEADPFGIPEYAF